MAVYEVPSPTRVDWLTEVRAAMNDALKSKGVLVTVIICGTVVTLALVGVLGWLAWAQRDANYIMTLVNTLLTALLFKRVSDVNGRVVSIEKHTNGTTSRLLDATIGAKDKE